MSKYVEQSCLAASTTIDQFTIPETWLCEVIYLGPMIAIISPALTMPLDFSSVARGFLVLLSFTKTQTFSHAKDRTRELWRCA
jgi:hypothetical protein